MTSEIDAVGNGKAVWSIAGHPIFGSEHHPIRTPWLSLQAVRGRRKLSLEELFGQARVNHSPGEQTTAQSKSKHETEQNNVGYS